MSGDNEYTFMDNESYDQITLSKEQIGDGIKYLKENMVLNVLKHGDKVIGVDLPNVVELKLLTLLREKKGIQRRAVQNGNS